MSEVANGQMIQMVKSVECGEYPLESDYQFNMLDIVHGKEMSLGIILAGPILIPDFDHGSGSGYSEEPLDFKSPQEWRMGFHAYIVLDFDSQVHKICIARQLKKLPENRLTSYIFYDHGSGSLRLPLGLTKFAEKLESIKEG